VHDGRLEGVQVLHACLKASHRRGESDSGRPHHTLNHVVRLCGPSIAHPLPCRVQSSIGETRESAHPPTAAHASSGKPPAKDLSRVPTRAHSQPNHTDTLS
jgi:hypothetical protein